MQKIYSTAAEALEDLLFDGMTIAAEIELDRLAREPGPRILHLRQQIRLGHRVSPVGLSCD